MYWLWKFPITDMREGPNYTVPGEKEWLFPLTGCQLKVMELMPQHTDKVAERTD